MSKALSILSDDDRAFVSRCLAELGMEPDDLDAVPPLRKVVEMLACTQIVKTLPVSRELAWAEANHMLGLKDTLRTWYRWQRRAAAHFCQDE